MKILNLLLCFFISLSLFAVPPAEKANISTMFDESSAVIESELIQLNDINNILIDDKLTFTELETSHPQLVSETNLSPVVAEGMFDKHPDSPLGIPAFWWGFCLGWVGMLVVYLVMDEGSDRKDQVKNALYGCLIGSLISLVAYLAIIAGSIF